MNTPTSKNSRLRLTTDLEAPGKNIGDLLLTWSDNEMPLGSYPVPVMSIRGADGPTVLIIGGTHGDEFEGPAAIFRLAEQLDPAMVPGLVEAQDHAPVIAQQNLKAVSGTVVVCGEIDAVDLEFFGSEDVCDGSAERVRCVDLCGLGQSE